MKTIILFWVMCIFGMLSANGQTSVWNGSHTTWTKGTGTANDPYLIENAQQLAHLAYIVNNGLGAGNGRTVGANTYWKLTTDIDLNGSETFQWTPIGYYNSESDYYNFGGHFDGDNHTIANLFINTSAMQRIGLFGYTDGGSIKNVGIVGNSSVTRTVSSLVAYAGGIAGYANNTAIDNCYNTGVVFASASSYYSYSGGISGYSTSSISNCYNTGTVSASSSSPYSGGIAGYSTSSISNCYNTGAISATDSYSYSDSYSGGIAGRSTSSILNCYSVGSIAGQDYKGGIVGYGTATNSYYLVTCGAAGAGQSRTEAFMKTKEFVDLLNGGSYTFKLDVAPLQNNGYPLLTFFEITTLEASNITQTKANFKSFIKAGNVTIVSKGFQYRIVGEANYTNQLVTATTDTLTWLATGLAPNKSYEYRTYAVSAANDTAYGEVKTFATLPITVTTSYASDLTQTKATLNGIVIFGDAPAIKGKGFEYKLNTTPAYTRINVTGDLENIAQTITGLQPNKIYQFRVFAVYANDTVYGNVETFTTRTISVHTANANAITRSSAVIHGQIYGSGDATLSAVGFIVAGKRVELPVSNSFSYTVTGLSAAQTVRYKAFAVCDGETFYADEEKQFTTPTFNTGNGGYLIENKDDLILLANLVNGGNRFQGAKFFLANDIILPENTPNNVLSIGNKETNTPFSGTFNGQDFVIKNVYIDRPNTPYQGFFGYTQNAQITNLGLSNITASGRNYTGGLVAYAENTDIRNSYVSGGTLFALSYCGGLVGYQTPGTNSIITGCYNTCEVTGSNYVGGLLGYSDKGTVRNSYVAALVSAQGNAVGAIIGGAQDVLSYYCYFNSSITGQESAIGDNRITTVSQRAAALSNDENGKSSSDMRMLEFVNTLNHGLTAPMWKMDYNPPINSGFPILIWQTDRVISNIKNVTPDNAIGIYPNPVSESFRISGLTAPAQVIVTDVSGKTVLRQTVGGDESIAVGHLPRGVYLVNVNGETRKIVKE